jgi:hypothetical protein
METSSFGGSLCFLGRPNWVLFQIFWGIMPILFMYFVYIVYISQIVIINIFSRYFQPIVQSRQNSPSISQTEGKDRQYPFLLNVSDF